MTTTTGRDSNCCRYFLVKIIFFIEGVLGRVLFFLFNGSLMISCKCTGLLLMLSPRLCLISWFVSTCVTNRCELTTWEHLLQLQSVYQGWIQQMQKEEGKNLLKTIIIFFCGNCEITMVNSNAGAKSWKGLPAPPPTAEIAAVAPTDPLGQLVIAFNFCTVTS